MQLEFKMNISKLLCLRNYARLQSKNITSHKVAYFMPRLEIL